MQVITKECVDRLEKKCGAEVNAFLRHVTFSNIDHEDNTNALRAMAQELEVPSDQFSSYVRAKLYARVRNWSYDELDPPELVAKQLGWKIEDFCEWLDKQADTFNYDEDEDDDFRRPRQQSLFPDPWEKLEDVLEDFQEDAELEGD